MNTIPGTVFLPAIIKTISFSEVICVSTDIDSIKCGFNMCRIVVDYYREVGNSFIQKNDLFEINLIIESTLKYNLYI